MRGWHEGHSSPGVLPPSQHPESQYNICCPPHVVTLGVTSASSLFVTSFVTEAGGGVTCNATNNCRDNWSNQSCYITWHWADTERWMYSGLSAVIMVLMLMLWSTCNSVVTRSPAPSLQGALLSPDPLLRVRIKINNKWGWKVHIMVAAKIFQILIMLSYLKRLQIHRRLVYANIFPGPEFLRTSTICKILQGILAWTGRNWPGLKFARWGSKTIFAIKWRKYANEFLSIVQCPQKFLVIRVFVLKTETGS